MQGERGISTTEFEDEQNGFFDALRTIDVHFGFATEELESRDESEESVEMVAVEVRDEDVLDAGELSIGIAEGDLGSLSTIDEEQMTAHFEQLSRRAGIGARGRTVTT
ncbi:hypothetical protein HMPREF9072_00124 [Capnocytophaga sp. oral taxon 324 str. F0483]|nr:hypothetical protein HMPREF9072_00124 [Capnocytophaga sp. oral taxon 324 str. F0483]